MTTQGGTQMDEFEDDTPPMDNDTFALHIELERFVFDARTAAAQAMVGVERVLSAHSRTADWSRKPHRDCAFCSRLNAVGVEVDRARQRFTEALMDLALGEDA